MSCFFHLQSNYLRHCSWQRHVFLHKWYTHFVLSQFDLSLVCEFNSLSDIWLNIFFLQFFFGFSMCSLNAYFVSKGSFTRTISSSTWSIVSESYCSQQWFFLSISIFQFHRALVFPESFNIKLHSASHASKKFHCCFAIMISHFIKK